MGRDDIKYIRNLLFLNHPSSTLIVKDKVICVFKQEDYLTYGKEYSIVKIMEVGFGNPYDKMIQVRDDLGTLRYFQAEFFNIDTTK